MQGKNEKEKLQELMLTNFGQMVCKSEVMKIFRAELRKEAQRIVRNYFEQIVPDEMKMSEIIRDVILGMVKE